MADEKRTLILTIDDESSIRQSFRNYLEDYDYCVIEAESGRQGLELIAAEQPDLVLVDLRMPEIDGLAVLKTVTRDSPDIPIIVISGTGAIGDVVEALNLGAWNYLLKPIDDMSVLRHTVEKALERSRLIRENRQYREYLESEVALRTEALKDSVQKYRILTENLQDVVLSLSSEGIIIYCSPVIREFAGYAPDAVIGWYFSDLLADPGGRPLLADMVARGFRGRATESIEFALERESGDSVPVEISACPVEKEGEIVALQCVMRDISERKLADEEKIRLETQLRQAQKMESIGTLAGGVAHDFNNILSSVIGNTELVLVKLGVDHPVDRHLQSILKAGDRARELVGQILTFSRQSELAYRPARIDLVVKEALKLLRSSLPTTINIVRDIQPAGLVMADTTQIHQVVMNLCTNAYHAMQDRGGILAVAVAPVEIEYNEKERFAELTAGPHLRVSVTDTGVGMSATVLERIFEPYFTTKETGKGTGLGLSVVHGIIKSHRGMLEVESRPGKGAAFHVYLPVVDKAEEKQGAVIRALPSGTESVLVVDDEEEIIQVLQQMLEELGYKVIACGSSVDALNMIREKPDAFEAIVSDYTMPDMTGDVLAGEVSRIRVDIPFILCSGLSDRINQKKAREIGVKRFLRKPVSMAELAVALRDVLDQRNDN